MLQLNNKTIARIAAIQTLYNYYTNKEADIQKILLSIIEYYKNGNIKEDLDLCKDKQYKVKPSYGFLKNLVRYSFEDLNVIDTTIEEHLSAEWSLEKLSPLLLSILRVAIGEIIYFPEIPKKVIISEYTDITNNMLDENDIGFVNSILENCANKLRP